MWTRVAHEVTMSYSRRPGAKSARFESSYAIARMLMTLQTINRSVSLFCFHTGFFKYIQTYLQMFQRFIHKHTHELAQLLLMFSKYMYFRELVVDLAGVGCFKLR
ncbi:hypothetical protein HanPI659440_Chr16g0635081 [Helianthus annuus]|nr:hypothetical protein HanPI659440_Chr16g0635081 [Helianthus annuus]